jgi:triphosphoribosyl-dephospho-CoA synthase
MAQLACIWEATARKPGNVHRFQDFDETAYVDFLASAVAMGPALAPAARARVGWTILEGVRQTRRIVPTNTNLGILLLLAPLAAVDPNQSLRVGLPGVLDQLDVEDSHLVFQAIRLANPGGLGRVPEEDVAGEPTRPLREIMVLAADRDLVARQYADGFADVFNEAMPALEHGLEKTLCLEGAIVYGHLKLMATYPDSLIARKRGLVEAEEAQARARGVLDAGWPANPATCAALAEFDGWLRAEGNARNPGTTADLVAASLFAALREGMIQLPPPWPWSTRNLFGAKNQG